MATVICIPPHDGSFKFHVTGHLPEHYTLRPLDVSSVSGRIMYFSKENQSVSTPLQNGLRFFLHLNPAFPTTCLTVSPAQKNEREYEVPTFRINDPMSNLGTPSTSTVRQFRVSMLETYNLTAYYSHQGIVLDLLNLSRSVRINDA